MMIIRKATSLDIEGLHRLLHQVGEVHHMGRPDLFIAGAHKYNTDELNGLFFKDQESYQKQILRLYDNKEELSHFNKQARIQAEHYGSRHYAEQVLEVYIRAMKEKEEENIIKEVSLDKEDTNDKEIKDK